MAVITNLTVLTNADTATGFSELPSPHASGAAPAQDTENYIQNGGTAASVSQATGQADGTGAGFQYVGGSFTVPSPGAVFMWNFYAAPTNLNTWSNGGGRIGVGTEDNLRFYNALGSDFGQYPYGGWQNTAVDPSLTADFTLGTPPASTYTAVAWLPNVLARITKGTPSAMDVVRYGRGDIVVSGTETFASMAAANDAVGARWGLFQAGGGGYLWKGLMSLGMITPISIPLSMTVSNASVRVEDTPRVASTFNAIEINHASTTINWTSVNFTAPALSITGSAPVSPGTLTVNDNATLTMIGCVFTNMGTFSLSTNTTATRTTWRGCNTVTGNGATFTNCTFDATTGNEALVLSDLADMVSSDFTGDNTSHAVRLTSIGNGSMIWNGTFDASTYAATNGSTGSEVLFVDVPSGTLNLSVGSNATEPTIRTSGATVNIVISSTLTLTGIIDGSEVRVFQAGTTTEVAGVENTIGDFVAGITVSAVDISILALGYQNIRLKNVSTTTDRSIPIQQIVDRQYFT